jgi:hypothetical protein
MSDSTGACLQLVMLVIPLVTTIVCTTSKVQWHFHGARMNTKLHPSQFQKPKSLHINQ